MNLPAATPARTQKGHDTREAILAKAMDVASVEGLDGLSIGTLAQALGMSKSGLFAHFGSKEELQLATIQGARALIARDVLAPGLKAPKGLRRLCAVLSLWLDYAQGEVFRGGCFFSAVAAEFDSRPGPIKDLVALSLKDWMATLARLLCEAKALGELNPEASPEQLAFEFNSLVRGANNTFQLERDPIVFTYARRAIRERLGSFAKPGSSISL